MFGKACNPFELRPLCSFPQVFQEHCLSRPYDPIYRHFIIYVNIDFHPFQLILKYTGTEPVSISGLPVPRLTPCSPVPATGGLSLTPFPL